MDGLIDSGDELLWRGVHPVDHSQIMVELSYEMQQIGISIVT
jgi:hypothetical protein